VRKRLPLAAATFLLSSLLLVATASSTATSGTPPLRYIYDSDAAAKDAIANGWNLIDVGSQWSADHLPPGARGLVWVGDYDNGSCTWQVSDSDLKSTVTAARNDARVFGFFISDEPNPISCPNAPAQHKARSALIHSIAPGTKTVIVLDSNGFKGQATRDALDQLPSWKGAADYIGLDPYPCYQGSPCDFSWIDRTIAAANAAGLNYWGVIQAFDDSDWRWPTPAELTHMLKQWSASRESGSMTFAWTWSGHTLTDQPRLLALLRQFNTGRAASPCIVPNVLGLTLTAARTKIVRAGCNVGTTTRQASTRRAGTVIQERPAAGRRLAHGGVVALVFSTGRP
jgi:hypothetical protein